MISCPECNSSRIVKVGFSKLGDQNYSCKDCNRRFVPGAVRGRPPKENKIKPEKTHRTIKIKMASYEKLARLSDEKNVSIENYIEGLLAD
jgi:DNA-directed RNA polymerase subunit RPC12/RpoP